MFFLDIWFNKNLTRYNVKRCFDDTQAFLYLVLQKIYMIFHVRFSSNKTPKN